MTPTPPVITRVGIPSVWESTAWKTRVVRIRRSSRSTASGDAGRRSLGPEPGGDRGVRVAPDDQVHRQLDRLDELGLRVPPQEGMELAVERQRGVEVPRGRRGPQVGTCL